MKGPTFVVSAPLALSRAGNGVEIMEEFADYADRLFTEKLDWREKLIRFGEQSRLLFLRHPGSAGLTLGRVPLGPNLLRIIEALLGLLRDAGVPDRVAAFAGDPFALCTGASVYEEEQRQPAGTPGVSEVVQWLSGLPTHRFPNIVELAQTLVSGSIEERYSWGLERCCAV